MDATESRFVRTRKYTYVLIFNKEKKKKVFGIGYRRNWKSRWRTIYRIVGAVPVDQVQGNRESIRRLL